MARVSSSCDCGWGLVNPIDSGCEGLWVELEPLDKSCLMPWDKLNPLDLWWSIPWDELTPLDYWYIMPWIGVNPLDYWYSHPWTGTVPIDDFVDDGWVFGVGPDSSCEVPWGMTTPIDEDCQFPWDKTAPVDLDCGSGWIKTTPKDLTCLSGWDIATILDVVCTADNSPVPTADTIVIYCSFPWLAARSYIVIDQDVTFIRVSDSQEISLLGVSIGSDIDSFFWTISGNVVDRESLSYIDPVNGPVEVQLVINGYTWRFWIEEINESYQYDSGGTYSFSGTSPSVALAKPYDTPQTKTYTAPTTANQIAANEVNPEGWAIQWDIAETWPIPADVFGVSEASKAEICSILAKGVGGYVNTIGGYPDGTPYAQELKADYRYKTSPKSFDIAVMDHTVIDGILSQSTKWEPKPKYDHVFITGQDQGEFAHVKRSGQPWTQAAPSVTDVLILDTQVLGKRGRNILDKDGYDQTIYNLDLTLPDSAVGTPSVMHPGELIEVTDLFETWRGMIRGVNISVANPGVTQSVEIERHHIVSGLPISWDNSFTLTLDNANVDSDLTDFPVLIKLSANCGVNNFDATAFFTELQNNGNRRRIKVEDAVATELYVEIESYSQLNLEAWLWVKVPTLTSGSTTVLTVYYDRDQPENTTYIGDVGSAAANNVWDANYVAVYHLKEDPTGGVSGIIKDSKLAHNATPVGTMDAADLVTGRTYKALQFDGTDDYIDCTSAATLRPDAITVESWCYSANTASKYLVSNPATVAHNFYDYVLKNDKIILYTTGGPVSIGSRTPVQDTWEYLVLTHVTGAQAFYFNGGVNASSAVAGTLSYETAGVLANTYLACWQPGQNEEDIIIDEVRISNIARTAAWIKATFHSNTDNLITYT